MTLTRRGWAVLAVAAAAFGLATGDWSYYSYEPAPIQPTPYSEVYLP